MTSSFGLRHWADVAASIEWPTLLIGNGASRALSGLFSYRSLYGVAPLSADDRLLFDALKTRDFEDVLMHLRTARLVCRQLGHNDRDVALRYRSIRRALITAVHDHHLSWLDANAGGRLLKFRTALRAHRKVFTTNYDLLAYWAIMNSGSPPGDGFGDLFWNASYTFDPLDTTPRGDKTLVYWLHGGLHLYRGPGGETIKRTSEGATLLETFGTRIPLFVSEGTPDQKRAAIRRSDYLEHAFAALAGTDSNLVLFGHALGRPDEHIVRALRKSRRRRVAYAVYPTTRRRTELDKARIAAKLPGVKIMFFDSRTHPLGDPALLVP